jgi:ribose transport system permease protein
MTDITSQPALKQGDPQVSAWSRLQKTLSLQKMGIVYVFILLCVLLSFASPVFLQPQNLINIIRQASVTGIIAIGMTFLLATGQFDLSVGAQAGLTGVIILLLGPSIGLVPAMIAAFVAAALVGTFIGLVVTKVGLNSLITTLGTLSILKGILLLLTDGRFLQGEDESLRWFANGMIGPFPFPVVAFLVIALIGEVVLIRTIFGRHLLAVGSNPEASRLVGLPVHRLIISTFVLSSICAAIGGVILLARIFSADANNGLGIEFIAITAAVVGGTSVFGGEASIWKTGVGVLLLQVLSNGFNILNVGAYYQDLIQGALLLGAVTLYTYQRRRH